MLRYSLPHSYAYSSPGLMMPGTSPAAFGVLV